MWWWCMYDVVVVVVTRLEACWASHLVADTWGYVHLVDHGLGYREREEKRDGL